MKFRDLPHLCRALEMLAVSCGMRIREDLADQVVPRQRRDEFALAEDAAARLDEEVVGAFIDAGTDSDDDALETVCTDKSSAAARLLRNLGDSGEALDNVLDDAKDGELCNLVMEAA